MNKLILIILIILINISALSSELEIIELHDKSIDQLLLENIKKYNETENTSTDKNITNNENIQNDDVIDSENFNQEDQLTIDELEKDELENEVSTENVLDNEDMWKKFEKELFPTNFS